MQIAILALQGAFQEHMDTLKRIGVPSFLIRQKRDLERPFDGLILPGGESTVMGKLLKELALYAPLLQKIKAGLPVFGTCAGLLLLAHEIEGGNPLFGTMDVAARRNAYGRQLGSFRATGAFGSQEGITMPFIRAPYLKSVGSQVEILSVVDGKIVAARQNHQLVTAFHPELTGQDFVHSYFLDMVQKAKSMQKQAAC